MGTASRREPSCDATCRRPYRSSSAGLNTCTRCRAICARRTRRISSSLFPLNMLPQMTSMRPAARPPSTAPPQRTGLSKGLVSRPSVPPQTTTVGAARPPPPLISILDPSNALHLYPVLLRKLLDPAFGINKLPLTGVERVAARTDLDADLFFGRPRQKRVAAGARYRCLVVRRMDSLFHLEHLGRRTLQAPASTDAPRPKRGRAGKARAL